MIVLANQHTSKPLCLFSQYQKTTVQAGATNIQCRKVTVSQYVKTNPDRERVASINPAGFQRLCDSYLKKRGYEHINPLGLLIGVDKVRKVHLTLSLPGPMESIILPSIQLTKRDWRQSLLMILRSASMKQNRHPDKSYRRNHSLSQCSSHI